VKKLRRINIGIHGRKCMDEMPFEIVERKGKGHPDYICDAIMEQAAVNLSKEYLKRVGVILHYNLDKGLLVAGKTQVAFGGGKVIEPMLLVFGDRATAKINGEEIPINDIVINAAKEWIKDNLRFVDPDEHLRYQVEIKEGSEELTDIFRRGKKVLGANDTSAAVGYAPLSKLERLVLDVEKYLNSSEFKKLYPETGEDIKVMGYRVKKRATLTIALAFVDRFIESERKYFRLKREILENLNEYVKEKVDFRVKVNINTLDKRGRGVYGVYLTVLGTSAECADCGEVGRGNRVNGLIPLNRPVSNEAAAGKNPVSHVGKIYNILTHKLADDIYKSVSGIKEVYVWLVSHIGQPINYPATIDVQIIPERGFDIKAVRSDIEDVINSELDGIYDFCMDLAHGKFSVC